MIFSLQYGLKGVACRILAGMLLLAPSGPAQGQCPPSRLAAELTLGTGSSFDSLGTSIAISGNTAVIGVPGDRVGNSAKVGSALVYTRTAGVWTFQARLRASDGALNDNFGESVSISGNIVVVGAPRADVSALNDAGAAYVFVRSGTTWTQQSKLASPSPAAFDAFGHSVAIWGTTIAVGVRLDDTPASNTGSVCVFAQSGTTWPLQQVLTASDAGAGAEFGFSVAIEGPTIIVGAPLDSNGGGTEVGAAYLFTRSGSSWSQEAKLVSSVPSQFDRFGIACDVSGGTAIVGSSLDDLSETAGNAGSVHVFTRSGMHWDHQARLLAPNPQSYDRFGYDVDLDGDVAVIGRDRGGLGVDTRSGSILVFTRAAGAWTLQEEVPSPATGQDWYGNVVAMAGGTILVGAQKHNGPEGSEVGAAYAYTRPAATWVLQGQFREGVGPGDERGATVAVSGDTAVVGIPGAETAGDNAGMVQVYNRSGTLWQLTASLVGSDTAAGDRFGSSVDIDGDTIVVGAINDDSPLTNAGSAYIFVRNVGAWTEQAKLVAGDAGSGDLFGSSTAISGDIVVIGAPNASGGLGVNDPGAGYVFARSNGAWNIQSKLIAPAPYQFVENDLGSSAAVDGDTVVLGDPNGESFTGSVHVFTWIGPFWTHQTRLVAPNREPDDYFGGEVDLVGDTIVAGASQKDFAQDDMGAAYIFTRSGGLAGPWTLQHTLVESSGGASHRFGSSVGLSGDRIVVGAYGAEAAGVASGTVEVFERSGGLNGPWSYRLTLVPPVQSIDDRFGWASDVSGSRIVIGALSDDTLVGTDAGAAYLFEVFACPADFNCSNTLTVQDIFDFLAAYFAADPRTDFNSSGMISVQDIFDFLAAYFGGCV